MEKIQITELKFKQQDLESLILNFYKTKNDLFIADDGDVKSKPCQTLELALIDLISKLQSCYFGSKYGSV